MAPQLPRRLTPGQLERAHRLLLDTLAGSRLDLRYQLTLDRLGPGAWRQTRYGRKCGMRCNCSVEQVVYARNSNGAVVARQVLAISDAEELVCFEVYPAGIAKEMKHAFVDYDRNFAKMLGLQIHDPNAVDNGGPSSDAALLLASHWWDDSAWDLRDRE